MLTLLLKSDKSLVNTTPNVRIYQRESYMDTLQVLIPLEYDGTDLSEFTVAIEYIDPANIAHAESMVRAEDIYKEKYYSFTLPIDSKFTEMAGKVIVKITMAHLDTETQKEQVFHSMECRDIEVLTWDDYFAYTPSAQLGVLDQKILELQNSAQQLKAVADEIKDSSPDDLQLNDTLLQLSHEGEPMGQGVELPIEPIVSI